MRLSYALRVVGFLGHDDEVAILEGVSDNRRTAVAVREVQTWPVAVVCERCSAPLVSDIEGLWYSTTDGTLFCQIKGNGAYHVVADKDSDF
jgi:hypothetical protein